MNKGVREDCYHLRTMYEIFHKQPTESVNSLINEAKIISVVEKCLLRTITLRSLKHP